MMRMAKQGQLCAIGTHPPNPSCSTSAEPTCAHVQALLGQKSLATTARYTHLASERLRHGRGETSDCARSSSFSFPMSRRIGASGGDFQGTFFRHRHRRGKVRQCWLRQNSARRRDPAGLKEGGGQAGSTTISIVPWAGGFGGGHLDDASGFLTYVRDTGFRELRPEEYVEGI
jgi:hypothetical protein